MADDDSLQDSRRGVPGDIQILREDATVATAASEASQGSAAVFQWRAGRTWLEIEQDKVIVRKGDRGLPGSMVAAGVLSPSVAGAAQVPTSASVLASLMSVVD